MKAILSPWARGALTIEERLRLKWHLTHLVLDVGAERSPQRFVVTLRTEDRSTVVAERRDVGRTVLFTTIEAMLAEAGQPLLERDHA